MLKIKLIAVDLDETFLNADAKVSSRNRTAITKAVDQGIIFVVATGRMRYRIPDDVISIPGLQYLVSANGASVVDLKNDNVLYADPIPGNTALEIVSALKEFPIYMELYHGGYAYTDKQSLLHYSPKIYSPGRRTIMARGIRIVNDLKTFMSDSKHAIDKINIPFIPPVYSGKVSDILHRPEIISTQSLPDNAEVNHHTANKAEGIRSLCRKLDILPSEVMAFGDAENDLEMIRFAGFSVAMGNASPEVKACARYVTKTNEEDGVAWFLENNVIAT